tara:strand:- start:7457 stop:7720 length:264 start_codon:yes stop_codon:yes gene_type:complete
MPQPIPTTTFQLPQILFDYWKPKKKAEKKITEASVLELVKEKKISPGKAAELLNISRWNLMKLMSQHNLAIADFSPQELKTQIKDNE